MRLSQAVFFILSISYSYQHEIEKRETKEEKRVVCYYTNWSVYRPGTAKFNPQNINPYLCTHLIYAFGGLDRENGLRPYDKYQDIEQGGYAKFTGLKTYNKNLKTMLAIGGWNEGSARFSPLVADEERRKEFVKNVVKFLRVNHFDGLDLDWEYPAFRDGGKPHDKENYAQLVQELREEFERESSKTGRPRLLLTMAVPAGLEYVDKGYDIPKLNRYLDFMNILSYDYHSAFEPSINHHSPLYSLEEAGEYNFDSQLTIDATVKHYLLKGADANKLVLGIPTYGRSYTLFNEESTDIGSPADGPGEQGDATREKGYLAYYEICANVKSGWTVKQPKESAMGPYAFKGNQWVGYDDEAIVKRKSEYVNEKNLGGIMFWSIDNDDFRGKCSSRPYPLIEAAKEALLGTSLGAKANKLPSSPRGGKTSNKGKLKATRTTTQPSTTPSHTTPDPPTTPDPGSDFVCKDEGFFPHPRDCKKYFWCLDSGPSNLGIVAHQFTCPSGLFFNKAADSCDFARNVICKKKSASATTTTEAPKTTKSESSSKTTARTTTTTTTTEPPPEEEEDEYIDERDAEDPQTIKQLISLIKKLGGVAELEKQLDSGSSEEITTPIPISKSLYQKVINRPNKFQPQRNGPSGPQNEGLTRDSGRAASFRKDRPKYVTIQRERPSTSTTETSEEEEEEVEEETEKPKYKEFNRNRGSQNEGLESKPTERSRPKYQPIERFRQKSQPQEKEEEEEAEEPQSPERSTTLKYRNIFRSRSTPSGDSSTATTSRYVTLQRQRIRPEDEGTTENKLEEEESTEEIIETTTTPRPRIKVSDVLTTTPGVRTSTRVVTQVVEGATQRQRVPLHKLQKIFKDSENLIETVTKPYETSTTEKKRPILNSFQRRRPEIVVTTTTRSTPAYLRRNRIRSSSTTSTTTEAIEVTKRTYNQRRFRPTTEVTTSSEETKYRRRNTTSRFSSRSTTESSQSTEKFTRPKSRYFNIRRTTTERGSTEEDGIFTREYSRESNVIRRPVQKQNETTSTLSPETTSLPSTDKKTTKELETTDMTPTEATEKSISNDTETTPTSQEPTDQPIELTTVPVVTTPVIETSTKNQPRNRTKIILRRRKPADSTVSESSGDFLKVKKSEIQSTVEKQQLEVSKDKKRVIVRRKKLEDNEQGRVSRGRTRFSDPDSSETEKRSNEQNRNERRVTTQKPEKDESRNERRRPTTAKPERSTQSTRKTDIQTEKTFKNEKPSRGRKKFVDELNEDPNILEKTESPKRRVVYRKTIKDLAVGESGIPGSNEEDVFDIGNSTNVNIWNSLAPEDVNNYFDPEEIQRVRRPVQRRPISRSTTTTTTTEASTNQRQRTTVQSLKQRLNRFKTEKTLKSTSPITEVDSTTIRSRKSEFRRLIKQPNTQRIEEEPRVQYHRQTSFKPVPLNRDDYRTTLIEEQATESSFTDEHITDERGVIRFQESNENDELGIGDLANVAVAAIQSLATSPPTQATEQYKVTTTRPTTRVVATQRLRSSRPTRLPTVVTTPEIIPSRSLVRSSPRPFSKVTQPRNFPTPGPAIYDDYEDYYAEPIDVPLSGKVRIHNDGYIECLDIGNFPHPFSCRKFISCAKMENGHLLGWEYTCPKGLSFDPIGGICNWNAGLGCKE